VHEETVVWSAGCIVETEKCAPERTSAAAATAYHAAMAALAAQLVKALQSLVASKAAPAGTGVDAAARPTRPGAGADDAATTAAAAGQSSVADDPACSLTFVAQLQLSTGAAKLLWLETVNGVPTAVLLARCRGAAAGGSGTRAAERAFGSAPAITSETSPSVCTEAASVTCSPLRTLPILRSELASVECRLRAIAAEAAPAPSVESAAARSLVRRTKPQQQKVHASPAIYPSGCRRDTELSELSAVSEAAAGDLRLARERLEAAADPSEDEVPRDVFLSPQAWGAFLRGPSLAPEETRRGQACRIELGTPMLSHHRWRADSTLESAARGRPDVVEVLLRCEPPAGYASRASTSPRSRRRSSVPGRFVDDLLSHFNPSRRGGGVGSADSFQRRDGAASDGEPPRARRSSTIAGGFRSCEQAGALGGTGKGGGGSTAGARAEGALTSSRVQQSSSSAAGSRTSCMLVAAGSSILGCSAAQASSSYGHRRFTQELQLRVLSGSPLSSPTRTSGVTRAGSSPSMGVEGSRGADATHHWPGAGYMQALTPLRPAIRMPALPSEELAPSPPAPFQVQPGTAEVLAGLLEGAGWACTPPRASRSDAACGGAGAASAAGRAPSVLEGGSACRSGCGSGARRLMRRRVSFHPDVTEGLAGGDGPPASYSEMTADDALAAFRAELHAACLAHAAHESSRTFSGEERGLPAGSGTRTGAFCHVGAAEASISRPFALPPRSKAQSDPFTQHRPAAEHAAADFPGSAFELSVAGSLASTLFAGSC
jgi:hypothetical protein